MSPRTRSKAGSAALIAVLALTSTACSSRPSSAARMVAALPPVETRSIGVLVTPTGVVAPILSTFDDGRGRWVRTPCWSRAPVFGGTATFGAEVVLDPGHGGTELGAVGPSGLAEKEVNLAVATKVAARLRSAGVSVVMTRTTDTWMTVRTRAEIARSLHPKLIVSIHHNSTDGPITVGSEPGAEVYHQLASASARRLAGLLWDDLVSSLRPYSDEWTNNPDRGVRTSPSTEEPGRDRLGILRYTTGTPAVLTESAFMASGAEESLLRREDVRSAEADALARGIRAFLSEGPAHPWSEPPRIPLPADPLANSDAACDEPPLTSAA